jgi:PAS domain S-box-containing protein
MSADDNLTPPTSSGRPTPSEGAVGARHDDAVDALRERLDELTAEAAALRVSEAEWRDLIETLPQIVWITRPDGWHTHFNQQWLDYTGLTLEVSLGHGWNPPFHPEDRARATAHWEQATSTGEPYEIEYRLRRRDGVYRWMLGRATPLHDDAGRIVKWFGTCTDIEELKQTQSELERRRALNRLAGSMARLGNWSLDLATNEVYWSEEMFEILEFPPGRTPGLEDGLDRYPTEHRSRIEAAITACATGGTPFDLELAVLTFRGSQRWVRAMGEPQYGPGGEITHLIGALQDISAMKAASRRNEELAERLSTTLESITDGFFTLDRDWRFTYVNRVAEELLQRDRGYLEGTMFWDEFAPLVGTEAEDAYRRAVRDNVTTVIDDFFYAPLDGWFRVHIYPSEQGLAVYFNDVSREHRNQVALRERVRELRALARVSGAAHQLTDPGELCSLAASSLLRALHDDAGAGVRVTLGPTTHEVGDLTTGPMAFATPVMVQGEDCGEIVVMTKDDGLLPEEQDLVRTIAETLGLWTGRHRATLEIQAINEQLNDANEQLEEAAQLKDDLLSMASHELRTPLTPILGFVELLCERGANLDGDQRRMLASMGSNARRMLRLVDDLLIISRATAGRIVSQPEEVSVAEVLEPLLDELGDALGEVTMDLGEARMTVDPQHLQQIVTNLLTNASKYGAPPIRVTAVDAGPGHIAVEVADQGQGIPPTFQERMWERFVQKDRGDTRTASGTGLGLAIIRLLAEANGGTVGYRDGEPVGAVFTVRFPGSLQ